MRKSALRCLASPSEIEVLRIIFCSRYLTRDNYDRDKVSKIVIMNWFQRETNQKRENHKSVILEKTFSMRASLKYYWFSSKYRRCMQIDNELTRPKRHI